jgi:predicted LPLAT superfamily acyltransferase
VSTAWRQRPEGGGRFAIWLIRSIGRHLGRAPARALLYPITLYFLIKRGPERRASRAYLTRVLGRKVTLRDVARHIHVFSATILDRIYFLGDGDMRRFDIRVSGVEQVRAQLRQGRGVLLIGSHLGSFEALRGLAQSRPDIEVRVVLDKSQTPAMTQLLEALNPVVAARVIDAAQGGLAVTLAIKQATDEGAMVTLLADRVYPGETVLRAPFLGESACFPSSPWLIAAALQVPVSLAFGLYRGGNRYDLVFETFSDGIAIARHNRTQALAELVERYAQRLEHHARAAPYNWFNFYDFWKQDDDVSGRERDTLEAGAVEGCLDAARRRLRQQRALRST